MILRKQKLQQGHLIMMVIPSLIIIIAALLLSVSPSTSTAQAKLTSPSISIPHKVQESSPLLTFTTPPLNSSQPAAAQLQLRDETSPSTITRRNLQEVIDPNQLLFFNLAFGFEPGSQREPTLDEMDVLLCKTNEWIQWRIEQKGLELFRNEQTVNVTAYYINWITLAAPLAGELPLNITFFVHAKYADTDEDVLPSVSFNAFNLVEADVALYITDYVWTLPDSNLFYFTTSVDYKIRKGEDAIPKSSQMAQTTCSEVGETLPPTPPSNNVTPLPAAVTTTAPSMAPLVTMATTTVSPTIATTTLVPNIMSPTTPSSSSTTPPANNNPNEETTTPPPAGGIGGIQIPPGNGIGGINIPPGNTNDRTQAPNNDNTNNENGQGPSTAAPADTSNGPITPAPIPDTPAPTMRATTVSPTEAASTSVPATTTTTPLPATSQTADPLPLEENNNTNNDTATSMPTAANPNNSNATTTPTPLELLPVAFRMEFTWVDPNYTTRQPNKQDVQQVMCTTQLYIQERLQVALAQEHPIRTKITNIQWTNTPDSVNDEEEPPEQSTVVLNMTCAAIYQINESTQEAIPPHLVVAALQGAPEGYLLEYITIGNDDNGGQDQNLIVDDRHDDIFSHVHELDLQPYALGTELATPGNLTSISCGEVMETLPYPADDLLGEPLDLDAIPTTFAGYNGLGTDKDNTTTNNSTATTDAPGSSNNNEDGTNDNDNTGGGGDGGNSTSNNDGGSDETDNDSNPSTDPMTPATTGQTQQQQQQPGQQQDVNQKRIDVSFIVSNLDFITIPAEVNRSGLSAAFPVFVETVFTKIANKTASSSQRQRQRQRRYLRSQQQPQRQLLDHEFKVSLVPGSAYVESLLKAQCGSNTHPNLVCHEAKAGYDVRLDLVIGRTLQEQTTSNTATADWWEVFLEDTYKGAHDGTLSEILKRETPDTPLFIGTVPPPDDSGGSKSDDVVMWVLIAVIIALAICIFCISWYTIHQRRQHAHDLEEQQRALMGDDGGKHGPESMHHHHHYPSATEPPSDQQKSTSSDEDKEEFMDEPEDDTDNDGFVDDYTDLDFVGEEAYLELLVEAQNEQQMIDSTGSTANSRSIGDGGEDSAGDNSETTPVVLHGLSTMSSHHNKSYPDVFEDEPDSDAHHSPRGQAAPSSESDGGSSSSSGGGSSNSSTTTSTNSSGDDDDDDEDVDWEDFDNTNGTPYVDATATATAVTELVGENDLEGSADSEEAVDWEDVDGQQPVNQNLDTNTDFPRALADQDTSSADKGTHDWRSFDNNDSIEIVFENDSGSGTGSGNGSGSDDVDWEEYEAGLPAAAAAGGGDSGIKAANFIEERAKEKQYFDNANGETSPLGEDDDEEIEWEEHGNETTDKKDPTAGMKDATNADPSDDDDDDDENVNWEEFDTNDKSASAKETENDAADFLKMQDSGSDSDVDWE